MSIWSGKTWEAKLPPSDLQICEQHLYDFFKMMTERQEIWYKRFCGRPKPWTSDELLKNNKFTNVYRELDRSSQWLIKNILLDDKRTLKDKVFNILMFRIINKPETFSLIDMPTWAEYDVDDIEEKLSILQDNGHTCLNQEAYKINTYIWPGVPRWKAYNRHLIDTYHKMTDQIIETAKTASKPEELVDLLKIQGIGSFLSHEYFIDFCYIAKYTDHKFMKFTENDFTNVGPGASVGLRLIFPDRKERLQEEGIYMLRDLSPEMLGPGFKYLNWDKKNQKYFVTHGEGAITAHQVEMMLCEYQKYWKMTIGEGKQRSKINAGEGNKDYSFYLY